jgi:Asp-tRNA(Asn)/Glu-tRNA(Gln) amidotransferase A subunit family amidase
MTHPQDMGLRAQAAAIASGELDPRELIEATLSRIEERDGPVNSIPVRFPERSLEMLKAAPPGALFGVPIAIKDMYTLPWRGMFNGTAHELLPAGASGMFRLLKDAGAVVIGVSNQHYLGMGTTGVASAYGPAANPWNTEHCAGGSSSGSAAAVSARLVGGSIGSDTGGSTRLPAAYCGVVGLKLTFGGIPRDGYLGQNSQLSAPGTFGRDSADVRLLTEAVLRRHLRAGSGARLRAGLARGPYWDNIDPEVEAVCETAIDSTGWKKVDLVIEGTEHAQAAGTILSAGALGSSFNAAVVKEADPFTRALIHEMMLWPATLISRADRIRAQLRRSVARAFGACDVLAWPTSPAPAPLISSPILQLPRGSVPADPANLRQATLANLTGLPGVSVPVGFSSEGLPIGLQLHATWGAEAMLLDAAEHVEMSTNRQHIDHVPPISREEAVR